MSTTSRRSTPALVLMGSLWLAACGSDAAPSDATRDDSRDAGDAGSDGTALPDTAADAGAPDAQPNDGSDPGDGDAGEDGGTDDTALPDDAADAPDSDADPESDADAGGVDAGDTVGGDASVDADAGPADSGSDVADTDASDTSDPDAGAPDRAWPLGTFTVGVADTTLRDSARADRTVYARVRAPEAFEGLTPIILVSHGGDGSERGYTTGEHLGEAFASAGYLVVHVGHVASTDNQIHLLDRPADVSFLLDALESERLALPDGFVGRLDLSRVGHIGHSYGAYTAHAVGGADYEQGNFRDERVDAIVALSPQGADQFGGYDRGGDDNTWARMPVPVYNLVGGDEVDTNALGVFQGTGWRLQPASRYPNTIDSYLSVIPGQNHSEMWNRGSDAVESFVSANALQFFEAWVRGVEVDPCTIGVQGADVDASIERRLVRAGGGPGICP